MASDRRQMIEDVALRLFAERGVADVSTRELADACGIGESALYRHMKSKEELARRVFKAAYLEFSRELRQAIAAGEGDFRAEIMAITGTIYQAFDRDPLLLRFLVLRQHDNIAFLDLGTDNPVLVVQGAVARAVGKKVIPNLEVEHALSITMGIILQALINTVYGRIKTPVAPLAPIMAAAVLRALNIGEAA